MLLRSLAPFLLALATGLGLAQAAQAAAQPLDGIVVVVNDGVILQSEIDKAMDEARDQIAKRGLSAPPEEALRAQVLERLILTRVQTQRAEQAGVRIDDRELNEVLNNLAKQNGQSVETAAANFIKEHRPSSLIQRFASVEEIANMVVYVASREASVTNGAALRAEGGLVPTIA